MLNDFEKTVLSDIKSCISGALANTSIPFNEDELYLLFDLYEFIDTSTCNFGKIKKTTVDFLRDDTKDTFMQQIIEYAVELDKSKIKEARDVVKLLNKLVEGEK